MDYPVPNFGLDKDIRTTYSSLDTAENIRRHRWVLENGWNKKKEENLDYPVPDFGLDEDVVATQSHIANQEKLLKHKWVPKQDKNKYWVVPTAAAGDSYTYNPSLVQLQSKTESDPICSSAGCAYKSEKGHVEYPKDFFVPNFGKDKDINHTWSSLDWAENSLRRRWVLENGWNKKKEENLDYPVPNFGLEEDVVTTQENLANTEKILKHKWVPTKDSNGVYKMPEAAKGGSYSYSNAAQLE